jgi:DNA-binding phage protein
MTSQSCENILRLAQHADRLGHSLPILTDVLRKADVQQALREVIGGVSIPEFAKDAGVGKDTIYRIMDVDKPPYVPAVVQIAKIVAAKGLTLTDFFARVEGHARIAVAPQDAEIREHADSSIHASGDPFIAQLIRLCLRAAAASSRNNARALFEELAVGFGMAHTPGAVDQIKRAIHDRRERSGDR